MLEHVVSIAQVRSVVADGGTVWYCVLEQLVSDVHMRLFDKEGGRVSYSAPTRHVVCARHTRFVVDVGGAN